MKAARSPLVALVAWSGFACAPSGACVNTFETSILVLLEHGDRAGAEKVVADLEAAVRKEPTLENSNDFAVGQLLLGKRSEAIALLREVEQKYPGKAIVAANLGTALELSGDDAEALRWIREGVRRDPNEHSGSEWLHARILEAKIAAAKDNNWFDDHTVLGIDLGTEPVPKLSGEMLKDPIGRPLTMVQVVMAISYQLSERTRFVEPPDAIVADLYAAAGDLMWIMGKPKSFDDYLWDSPDQHYDHALQYGAPKQALVRLRKNTFEAQNSGADWFSDLQRGPPDAIVVDQVPNSSSAVLSSWRWPLIVVGLLAVFSGVFYFARLRKP